MMSQTAPADHRTPLLSVGTPVAADKLAPPPPYDDEDPAADAYRARHDSDATRVRRRIPSLVLTLAIEMVNAAVINAYSGELARYPLLIAFIPVISALGGNISLQTSAITARAISHGLASDREAASSVAHEFRAAFVLGLMLGLLLFVIASAWRSVQAGQPDLGFGAVVGLAMVVSATFGGLFGAGTPLLYRRLGMDPASNAGPLDTALLDVLGNSLFLAISGVLINAFGY